MSSVGKENIAPQEAQNTEDPNKTLPIDELDFTGSEFEQSNGAPIAR